MTLVLHTILLTKQPTPDTADVQKLQEFTTLQAQN